MINVNKLRIDKHLSVRFQSIAKNYGLTTIGQLKSMLTKMPPQGKVSLPMGHTRANTTLKKLEKELEALF